MDITEKLTDSGKRSFNQYMIKKQFERGSQVILKGDCVSGVYFVLEGTLRVFTISADGRETTLYKIEKGDTCILALNSFFSNLLYPAWVEADQDSLIAIIPGDSYRLLFAKEPVIQDITIRALSSAVFGLMSELDLRHSQSLEQRLARYLMTHASSEGKVFKTQQNFASELGTTREVIGRFMAQFAKQKLITSQRGVVSLLDKDGLRKLMMEND